MDGPRREFLVMKVLPALIVFALWLDGWFYPLLLLPLLYVLFVERRDLRSIGFTTEKLGSSVSLGLAAFAIDLLVYLPVFFYYLSTLQRMNMGDWYPLFTDVIWYPLYEEITYRGFFLGHFTSPDDSPFSGKALMVNLIQAVLFLSIHHKHVTTGHPLLLIPVFLLGFLNGLAFLRTRNVIGCVLSHSLLNGGALLLTQIFV